MAKNSACRQAARGGQLRLHQLVSEEFPLSEGALMLAKADGNVKTMGHRKGNIGVAELS